MRSETSLDRYGARIDTVETRGLHSKQFPRSPTDSTVSLFQLDYSVDYRRPFRELSYLSAPSLHVHASTSPNTNPPPFKCMLYLGA